MSAEKILKTLHPLERKTLPFLKQGILFEDLVKISGLKDVEVMRALQWLNNKKALEIREEISEVLNLDKNGFEYKKKGLPEKKFLKEIKNKALTIQELERKGLSREEINGCIGVLKQKAAVDVKKDKTLTFSITNFGRVFLEKTSLEEKLLSKKFPVNMSGLEDEERFAADNLLRRKGILKKEKIKKKTVELSSLGLKLVKNSSKIGDVSDRLTPAMLKTGSWKKKSFREYDVSINVPKISSGRRHFVNKAINYMKSIWLEMGFTEMKGSIVQSGFWNLDTLFVPQDHPARAMQDTFYVKEPKNAKIPEWYKKVKDVHENGADTGSTGWGGKWSKEEASENMLRTHTTGLSAMYLDKIRSGEYEMPAKFFSVNKVFRNEALDWKHLFEFNQVEGIVIDPNANLKHLKGYLKEFFGKMGFTDIRMRPGHFPYTEPSVEVDVYNPKKKEWIELGGAGIFRPEVTKTLIGIEVPVLAWGLGMERIIVDYFGFKDLRDLYNNKLDLLRNMKEWLK
ncbi:phenylalanine--tRNA ligase subunit alpha [Candidatus Woesearchaeota archaeon]|nr:phenylalanine--tRNA ligase subunit alpha [Candidatus Woesearchaeota archaeon]